MKHLLFKKKRAFLSKNHLLPKEQSPFKQSVESLKLKLPKNKISFSNNKNPESRKLIMYPDYYDKDSLMYNWFHHPYRNNYEYEVNSNNQVRNFVRSKAKYRFPYAEEEDLEQKAYDTKFNIRNVIDSFHKDRDHNSILKAKRWADDLEADLDRFRNDINAKLMNLATDLVLFVRKHKSANPGEDQTGN